MRTVTIFATAFLMIAAAVAMAGEAASAEADKPAASNIAGSAELDGLFASLKVAPDDRETRQIEAQIWERWLDSGDVEVNKLMDFTIAAMKAGAFSLAINYLDSIVAMKPDYAEGWNKRATVYWLMRDYDKSLADIQLTLALEPRHWGAPAGLGMIMRDRGEKRKAVEAFRQALAIDPNLDDVKVGLDLLEDELGKDI